MLAHSPPLPLVIDYLDGDCNITADDKEGISLALKQPTRVRCIRLALSFQDLQKLVMAIDDELPILEYLVMGTEDDATLVFPETIQAPHLRHLLLAGVALPMGSRLLATAVGLVTLFLSMRDSSTYLTPNSLLQWISPLSQLEILVIFNDFVEAQLSDIPTITHATLPNLRTLYLRGVSAYLDLLLCQIATPRLEGLYIAFFGQLTPSIPCLVRFMNPTENKRRRFDIAVFEFYDDVVHVETEEGCYFFRMIGNRLRLNGHISFMAQIVDALSQIFSAVEHLILEHEEDSPSYEEDFEVEVDRTEWHKLLRPFSNVKKLRINHGLVEEFSRFLLLYDGELPPGLLPKLQQLKYSRSSNADDGFTSFVNARQNAGHPVSLVS